jgi:hypothetical protein
MGIEFNTKNKTLSLMGIVKNIYVCCPDLVQTPVEYMELTTAGMERKGRVQNSGCNGDTFIGVMS